MAKFVSETSVALLDDGREVKFKNLTISRLTRLMDSWNDFYDALPDRQEKGEEVREVENFINAVGICLEHNFSDDEIESLKIDKKSNKISDEYREYLEDVLDTETIYYVIEKCTGMKLNDPKLMEKAAEMVMAEDGKI